MDPFLLTVGISITTAIVASTAFALIQILRHRGIIPVTEAGLREYIKQLEKDALVCKENTVELKATNQALEADIRVREKEREALRDERVQLYIKIGKLENRIDILEATIRDGGPSGITASGSTLNIGRDLTGNDKTQTGG